MGTSQHCQLLHQCSYTLWCVVSGQCARGGGAGDARLVEPACCIRGQSCSSQCHRDQRPSLSFPSAEPQNLRCLSLASANGRKKLAWVNFLDGGGQRPAVDDFDGKLTSPTACGRCTARDVAKLAWWSCAGPLPALHALWCSMCRGCWGKAKAHLRVLCSAWACTAKPRLLLRGYCAVQMEMSGAQLGVLPG